MKRNRIAIILVVVLGTLSFWFMMKNRKSTLEANLRSFAVKDTAMIDKLFLADKNGKSVTLERQGQGRWTVNGKHLVRLDAIETLLYTIYKVDVKEPVSKKAKDFVVKKLAAEAVKCEIYIKGELIKAYYVGGETQDQTGTYMILIDPETMKAVEKPFVTYIPGFEGFLTTRYFTDEKDWRDRTVFSYVPNTIKSVKLEIPDKPEFGYEVSQVANNRFQVKSLTADKVIEDLDTLAVKQYLSYFQQINYESLQLAMKQQEVDSTLKTLPLNILTVTNDKGEKNTVKFFPRKPKKQVFDVDGKPLQFDPERMNALLNNGDMAIVQYYIFGKIMPPVEYFRIKKQAPLK